ncbi:Cof-type HAD-IIB family hydrolase [Weissella sagaensis]|jgi:Cof subfamily protein (haloacid dehalogenase superfamily)|uniref:Cof-type HAD-IIB family hydrolase n=1 Tax=Weissella sagaensis TaxID=2559928 RepID=A0ABW1RTM4_9LACO|nr:Cof-type HAD-IIB family hydrolase [Weissella sagaensis]KAA8433712.1 HAD family phosphatase [Weissella paramesenteroides]KAA8438470.1 HAD family phosphatase [Weissella paramesenteroides]MBU7567907.1 HAD family phosphatase [Weissella hellenica]
MTIRLVALDVDDTLLNSQGHILASTKNVLQTILNNGVKVVLCSGRPLRGIQSFLDELGIGGSDQYAITYNGSVIESLAGDILSQKGLSNEEYRHIDAYANKQHIQYYVLDQDGEVYTSNHDVSRIAVIQAWENDAGILIRKPDELANDFTIVKAAFVGEKTTLDQAEAGVHKVFDNKNYVVRAADNFLEVMHQSVNKGNALRQLTSELGISPAEVMVFGDEKNDIPMFDFAGLAVAMGNGSAAAKEHANYVTNSNDEDGIANALQKLVFEKE